MKKDKIPYITGWMYLDDKVIFVKCLPWRSSSGTIQVSVPRKYKLVVRTLACLHKSEAACIRRNILYFKGVIG